MLDIYSGVRLLGHGVGVCSVLVHSNEGISRVDCESSSCFISSAKFSTVISLIMASSFNDYFPGK